MTIVVSAFHRRLLMVLLLGLALLPLGPVVATHAAGIPTTWKVSSTKDTSTPLATHCASNSCPTLRDALVAAHSGDTVNLSGLAGSLATTAPLTVTTNLTISGPISTTLTVKGNQFGPTFWLLGNALAVNINNLTISNGGCIYKPIGAAGGYATAGGGIVVTAAMTRTVALTLTNTIVSNNPGLVPTVACGQGGGITLDVTHGGTGTLTLNNSTVTQNITTGAGGGILVYGSNANSGTATVTLNSSSVIGNTAGTGGGIYFDGFATGTLALTGTTVMSNTTAAQSGIFLNGGVLSLSVSNSHIDDNNTTASDLTGAGLAVHANRATMTMTGSTVKSNCGFGPYQGFNVQVGSTSTLTLSHSSLVGSCRHVTNAVDPITGLADAIGNVPADDFYVGGATQLLLGPGNVIEAAFIIT
jgi:hypothetical protein